MIITVPVVWDAHRTRLIDLIRTAPYVPPSLPWRNIRYVFIIDVCTTNTNDFKGTNVEILTTTINVSLEKVSKGGSVMSGHSKWASIKHKKAATDAKRGAAFTKVIREITAAAKDGGGNIETNIRLRAAISRAKEINMQKSNIDNAIKKGTGEIPGIVYETAMFEGYAPGGVAILVETLTDNKNRTTAEVRNLLNKKNGSLAGAGSTAWMFTKKGLILVEKNKVKEDALMDIVLEAGAEDMKSEGDLYEITCEPAAHEGIKTALKAKDIPLQTAEITMIPNSTIKVQGAEAKQVIELMESLEDHEDVQSVYANFDISDEELQKAS